MLLPRITFDGVWVPFVGIAILSSSCQTQTPQKLSFEEGNVEDQNQQYPKSAGGEIPFASLDHLLGSKGEKLGALMRTNPLRARELANVLNNLNERCGSLFSPRTEIKDIASAESLGRERAQCLVRAQRVSEEFGLSQRPTRSQVNQRALTISNPQIVTEVRCAGTPQQVTLANRETVEGTAIDGTKYRIFDDEKIFQDLTCSTANGPVCYPVVVQNFHTVTLVQEDTIACPAPTVVPYSIGLTQITRETFQWQCGTDGKPVLGSQSRDEQKSNLSTAPSCRGNQIVSDLAPTTVSSGGGASFEYSLSHSGIELDLPDFSWSYSDYSRAQFIDSASAASSPPIFSIRSYDTTEIYPAADGAYGYTEIRQGNQLDTVWRGQRPMIDMCYSMSPCSGWPAYLRMTQQLIPWVRGLEAYGMAIVVQQGDRFVFSIQVIDSKGVPVSWGHGYWRDGL